jgi:DNA-binding NarL/FixJ family response regulator
VRTLKILLADDHELVRRGLRNLLESHDGWEICAEAANGREAVDLAKKTSPDVVILDLSMPELNGLEATRRIRKARPETEVLILTMHESEELAQELLKVGARGYLLKSDADADVVAAVEALSRHRTFFTTRIAKMVVEGYVGRQRTVEEPESVKASLTDREREIVQLLAEGKSNKEIAVALSLSLQTVRTHRTNIMRKLDLHSIGEVIRYAVRNGLVTP